MSDGMTGAELIAAARRAGYKLSEHALKRYRDGGLIPRPHPAPTKGRVGIPQLYPPGTLEQLLAVCQLRKDAWRFDELRILVWWKRHWVDYEHLRSSLKAVIDEDPDVRGLHRAYEEAGHDPVEAAHMVLEEEDTEELRDPVLRLVLWRLGGNRADLYTVTFTLLVLAFGGAPEWDSTDVGLDDPITGRHIVEASPRELLDRAFGIDRLVSDDFGSGPFLKERPDMAATLLSLRDVGALDWLNPSTVVDAASDLELDQARDRVSGFFDLLPVVAKAMEAMLGRDFAAMGLFRAADLHKSASVRAMLVRYGLLLPKLVDDESVTGVSAALATSYPIFHAALELTGAFPGYKKYLTPAGVKQLDQ